MVILRESIGGAWILGIVMVFMMIFVAYISISINYSNAFRLKTEMVTIVEEYEGINPTSLSRLQALLDKYGYRNKMSCKINTDDKIIGVTDQVVTKNPTTKQSYCVTREERPAQSGAEEKYYYTIYVSFDFALPILGDIFKFQVNGETNAILYPNDRNF